MSQQGNLKLDIGTAVINAGNLCLGQGGVGLVRIDMELWTDTGKIPLVIIVTPDVELADTITNSTKALGTVDVTPLVKERMVPKDDVTN
jgi:hypothetical protein